MHTRSQVAWLLSCEKLFDEYKHIFFWTFTFTDVHNFWVYPIRWQAFIRDLVYNIYGGRVGGLRVIEIHREHGLHYHALLNRRVWIRLVRDIGHRYGIGRINVEKADWGAATYLAKYLDKKRFASRTKLVRWHSVGNFKPVHTNNLVVDSPFNRYVKAFMYLTQLKRISNSLYERLWKEYYDLEPRLLLRPPANSGPILTPEIRLSPGELDGIWPEYPEVGSSSSGSETSPKSTSLVTDSSTCEKSENGATNTRTKTYQLEPFNKLPAS